MKVKEDIKMIDAVIAILAVIGIYFVAKIIKGLFRSGDLHCSEEKPFYVFVITSEKNADSFVSEINNLCIKTKDLAYVVMVVNDEEPYSDYNQKAKTIVRSLLTENRDTGYHPILVFKTSKEYRKVFSDSFHDICIVKDFSSARDLLFRKCPGI